ncbi:phage gp46-like protein [Pedobacter sp. AK013]|uniref:hypothetical protein n=1 Tax=Pedobacter sp. AK013 TaxID=2723071 RepID=UPI0016212629|nr:hypothetical protein [Pedobacter sp. AK013]MBB6236489.1 phage gp46-like protein [Pedobacter sp. AK013]
MNGKDLLLYESGNGGEIIIQNNDLILTDQILQQAYLCLFGGNVEASTRGDELPNEIRKDWWGNSLFYGDVKSKQFNSQTEKALMDNPLTSSGRVSIIRSVESDLKYLKNVSNVEVNAFLLSVNKMKIEIKLSMPTTKTVTIELLWDSVKKEVIIENTI